MSALPANDPANLAAGWTESVKPWLDAEACRARALDSQTSALTRELWKYTPLPAQIEVLRGLPTGSGVTLIGLDQPGVKATRLDTAAQAGAATADERARNMLARQLDGRRHLLADLALLHGEEAWLIEIDGTPDRPIELRHAGTGTSIVMLALANGASATLIEHQDTGGGAAQVTVIGLGRDARLNHHRAAFPDGASHWSLVQASLEEQSEYALRQLALGGSRARLEIHVRLCGRGASTHLTGAYLVAEGQHLDQQLVVEHQAPETTSRQQFHGIGTGKGRSIFNGRIHIHPRAARSDAWLSNRNLALHPAAEMYTKPELEIYTDDVRCAHGATVGQLAADALFLLGSRGIPEPDARRMLAHAFLRACIDGPLANEGTERLLGAVP